MKLDEKEKQEATDYTRRWDAMRPTWREHQRLRDNLYGIRVEDDPHPAHAGGFAVCCPEHGWIGDDLTIAVARSTRDAHELVHNPQGELP